VQRIGAATSADPMTWRTTGRALVEPDPRWYERLADGAWIDGQLTIPANAAGLRTQPLPATALRPPD
jgi:hypothetical protein